ncbi:MULTISPECIES: molybdopterin-dependent oxidoreductase [unclassified Variovorax]|uniref:molybdopterin-dependent oxidoreductase n=1 Tax=unclassified Variovorax TaxID=663243 RepID=UPI00087EEA8A|nr:molybdopterin-dependent oxidoreductase [Variovorax sp. CF079]SDC31131.1 Oxidoreductase molybdopterin binding domain-containing protein [Variovorax sp. CF079]
MHLLLRLILCLTLFTAPAIATAQPSQQLEVAGAVRQQLRLDAAALAAFPAAEIGQFTQSRSGQGTETRSSVRGVKVSALVARAGLAAPGRNDWKTLVVVATATDGYRALFSWPEISNTAVGEGVLVLFERDGKALDEREGRIALISAADHRLGARHVRNLMRIEVRALD